jgi:hypothetical protein
VSSTTESTQGPSSTISLEEATGSSTTESTQGPSSTISLKEATGSSIVTIQPLSESETVTKSFTMQMISRIFMSLNIFT